MSADRLRVDRTLSAEGINRKNTRAALWLLPLVLLLMLGFPAKAAPQSAGLNLSNPATAYRSFVAETRRIERLFLAYRAAPSFANQAALGSATFRLALSAFDLDNVPAAARPHVGLIAAAMIADILHRVPPPPDAVLDALENVADPPARWTVPGTDLRLVRITDGPRSGDYVFSAATIARLAEFHDAAMVEPLLGTTAIPDWTEAQAQFVGPLLAGLPVQRLPDWLRAKLLDTPVWKSLAALLAIGLAVVVFRLWSGLVTRFAVDRSGWRLRLALICRPVGLALISVTFYVALITQTAPAGLTGQAVDLLNGAALVLAAAWSAWHLSWLAAEAAIASPRLPDETYDANLLRLVARVASVIAVGVIGIYGASLLGVPALGLLAGVSIGGVALALAAQSTLENLLGGFVIFTDRPFRVGDIIRHGTLSGRVEAVGPRSSRIRAADGTLTSVPNAELAKAQLTNLSARDRWTFTHRFPLPADLPAETVARLVATLRERIAAHPALTDAPAPPRATLVPLETSGLGIELAAPMAATTRDQFLAVQEALILEALRVLEARDDCRPVAP